MRILVHEFVSGGGFAGRDAPASLAREGVAMRTALAADLAAGGGHQVVVTADPRFPLAPSAGVEVVTVSDPRPARLDQLVASVDAVWLVAPETDRCLERLAARIEAMGRMLLGSSARAIRDASNKASLARRLRSHGIPHPDTRVLCSDAEAREVARAIGYPLVIKPVRGAGCEGVCLARDAQELDGAVKMARRAAALLVQRYVPGLAASVSLLSDGQRTVALSVNQQSVRAGRSFSYRGGRTPLDHPLAARAVEVARRTCAALPGLRGYVGVDMVLTDAEAVVIEVNPRLTTAYLGVRAALDRNIAALALAACSGRLPSSVAARRHVHFSASGRILCA